MSIQPTTHWCHGRSVPGPVGLCCDPAAPSTTTWVPGQPLHHRGTYGNYLYNFREDGAGWGDAASWPRPMSSQDLGDHDELAALIDWHRLNTYCTQRAEEAS